MGLTTQGAIALAMAWLLGATSAQKRSVDWLHIPKTGSSFAVPLLLYKCGYLEKSFRKPDDVDIGTGGIGNFKWLLTNSTHKVPSRCRSDRGHTPLGKLLSMGHGKGEVDNVVAMFRFPLARVASGFVYGMKSCFVKSALFQKSQHHGGVPPACAGLEEEQETPQRIEAERVVLQYAQCSAGCMTGMITGVSCAHKVHREESKNATNARVALAIAKLNRFAFVGLTERWSQSMCLFAKLFPRESGNPYPSTVSVNTRLSQGPACKKSVLQVFRDHGYQDEADAAIYAHAVKLFEQTLAARAPECEDGNEAPSTTLPPTLLL